jgi:hypothetical protein
MVHETLLARAARVLAALLLAIALVASGPPAARAAEPITVGFGMALTGGLAAIGKSALLAMQIWAEDVNAKGGLLGRQVKLVYYDDQSNPAMVPGLYTKLIDVDKVDFVVSGYATNMVAPAMPVVIQHNRLFLGLFGLAVNSEFHYPRYFSMLPTGPEPKFAFSQPYFDIAMGARPAARDDRERRRRRGVLQERLGRRPLDRQEARPQDRLRPLLPADHDRLHADRALDPGVQPGPRLRRLLPAGQRRHRARRQ